MSHNESTLHDGETLNAGQFLRSKNGLFHARCKKMETSSSIAATYSRQRVQDTKELLSGVLAQDPQSERPIISPCKQTATSAFTLDTGVLRGSVKTRTNEEEKAVRSPEC